MIQGKVYSVATVAAGGEVLEDLPLGTRVIPVEDASDFDEFGGFASIDDQTFEYASVDMEEDVIYLKADTTFAISEGDMVLLEPQAPYTVAIVTLDNLESVEARVSPELSLVLHDGERNDQLAETVVLEVENGVHVVKEVVGREAVIDAENSTVVNIRNAFLDDMETLGEALDANDVALTEATGRLTQAEADLEAARTRLTDAESGLSNLGTDLGTNEQAIADAQAELDQAKLDIVTAKQEAIDAAALDATSKANAAQSAANDALAQAKTDLEAAIASGDADAIADAEAAVATAKQEAIDAAALDATEKANAAQSAATQNAQTALTNAQAALEQAIEDGDAQAITDAQALIATAKQEAIDAAYDDATAKMAEVMTKANSALTAAQSAQATADNAIRTYYAPTPPWADNTEQPEEVLGDMWYDDNTGQAYRWNGTTWIVIVDQTIGQALSAAQNAQSTADGKITAFYKNTEPMEGDEGDLWFDLDDNNKVYRRTNGEWVSIADKRIAAQATLLTNLQSDLSGVEGTLDGKSNVWVQAAAPTGLTTSDKGDIWINDGATPRITKVWNGTGWIEADSRTTKAVADIAKKVTTYYSATSAPTAPAGGFTTGDLWVNATGKIARWNGSWVTMVDPKALADAAQSNAEAASVAKVSKGAGGATVYTNPLSHAEVGQSLPGSYVIDTPITPTARMTKVTISGYSYVPGESEISAEVGFYGYRIEQPLIQTSFTNHGSAPITCRLAVKASTGTISIILDIAGGVWRYPTFTVPRVEIRNGDTTWINGWSMHRTEDLTGYTNIMTPPARDMSSKEFAEQKATEAVNTAASELNAAKEALETAIASGDQAAIDAAKADATAKDNALETALTTVAQNKADAAKQAAIDAAKLDATAKADAAELAAKQVAAADATSKANAAQTAAEAAAATYADTVASGAKQSAIDAAEADATAKANAAEQAAKDAAIAAAALDATAKANAAKAGAVTDAKAYTDAEKAEWLNSAALTAQDKADLAEAEAIAEAETYTNGRTTNITSTQIADDAITTPKIATNAIDSRTISANAITSDHLTTGSVIAGKIAADAVLAANIKALEIDTGHLKADAITADKIATDAVTADSISANSIGTIALSANAVTTEKLDAEAVTADKLLVDTALANKINANIANIVQANIGNLTVVGDTHLNNVVAQRIAGDTAEFISLTVDQLTATGTSTLNSVVAQTIATEIADIVQANIGNLTVTGDAHLNTVTAERIAADVGSYVELTVDQLLAGNLDVVLNVSAGGAIIAGDAQGRAAQLEPDGLSLYDVNPDGERYPSTVLGGPGADQLSLLDGAGDVIAGIDAEGAITGNSLSVNDDISVGGMNLLGSLSGIPDVDLGWLDQLPRGMIARTYGSAAHSRATAEEWGYFATPFTALAGRVYKITSHAVARTNKDGAYIRFSHRLRTGGGSALVSDPAVDIGTTGAATYGHHAVSSDIVTYVTYPEDTEVSVLLSYIGYAYAAPEMNFAITMVEDVGLYVNVNRSGYYTTGGAQASTPDPAPVRRYTSVWHANGSATYRGNGTKRTDTPDLVQGYTSYAPINGHSQSAIIFTGLADNGETSKSVAGALAGATLEKAEIYLYFDHWYYGSGGTARIGKLGGDSIPSTLNATASKSVSGWKRGQGKWVQVPTSWFSDGNRGITLGGGSSTSALYYGRAADHTASWSRRPKMRLTYTR